MIEIVKPMDIEKRSFEIITELLGDRQLDSETEPVVKRVIHTTADFDYADSLHFSEHAVRRGVEALRVHIPVKYIGVGETLEDLQKFDSDQFVNALFDIRQTEEEG